MTQCTKRQGIYSGTRTWVIVGVQLLLQLARVHLSACPLKSLENKTIVQIVTLWIFTMVFICFREEILWLHHLTNIYLPYSFFALWSWSFVCQSHWLQCMHWRLYTISLSPKQKGALKYSWSINTFPIGERTSCIQLEGMVEQLLIEAAIIACAAKAESMQAQ